MTPKNTLELTSLPENVQTYWILFMDTQKWWGHLLKKGFSHVSVLYKDDYGCWAAYDPQDQKLQIDLISVKPTDNYPKTLANEGYTLIKIEKCDKIYRFPRIRWYNIKIGLFLNCVTQCRYFMSIKPGAVTPYGFYKKLVQLGKAENWEKRYASGISSVQLVI